jgi:hypothetical protein
MDQENPPKNGGKETKTPKQKTQKRNSPKKALKAETKLLCIAANPIESAVAVVAIYARKLRNPRKPKRQRARETER